jgi:hypothetical protein
MTWRKYGIWPAVAALLSVGAILAGCAAERQILTSAAGLSADTLRAGGLAVLGVTVVDEVEQVRPPLVAALESTLVTSRPDLPFRRAGSVRDTLGLAAYRRILFAYQSSGALAPADLGELSARLGTGARFLLVARVEKSSVNVSGAPAKSDAQSPYGISGSMRPPPSVTRDARVRIALYDLADRNTAWEAVYSSSSEHAAPDSLVNPRRRVRVEAPGGSADSRELIPESPETPSLAEALMEAFRALAADLPGAPPRPARAKK